MSRVALGNLALKIGLHQHVLVKIPFVPIGSLGEVFEALIGAVYVDSGYDLDQIERVLETIGYSMRPASDTSDTGKSNMDSCSGSHAMQSGEALLQPTTTSMSNEPDDRYRGTVMRHPDILILQRLLRSFRDFWTIYSETMSGRHDKDFDGALSRNNTGMYVLLSVISQYWLNHHEISDQLTWFPLLQHRYNRLFDENAEHTTKQLRRVRLDNLIFDSSRPNQLISRISNYRNSTYGALMHAYFNLTSREFPGFASGTIATHLRTHAGFKERDAFLAACRIEDEVRNWVRHVQGLPDWYDLPENQSKILPPWRIPKGLPADSPRTSSFAKHDSVLTSGKHTGRILGRSFWRWNMEDQTTVPTSASASASSSSSSSASLASLSQGQPSRRETASLSSAVDAKSSASRLEQRLDGCKSMNYLYLSRRSVLGPRNRTARKNRLTPADRRTKLVSGRISMRYLYGYTKGALNPGHAAVRTKSDPKPPSKSIIDTTERLDLPRQTVDGRRSMIYLYARISGVLVPKRTALVSRHELAHPKKTT